MFGGMRFLCMFTVMMPGAALAATGAGGEAAADAARSEGARFEAAQAAAARAAIMDGYDKAARAGLDAFVAAELAGSSYAEPPYIVVPSDGPGRHETIVLGSGAPAEAIARYRIDDGTVVSGGPTDGPQARSLSERERRMADARQAALGERERGGHALCTQLPPRTIVLPPQDDGTIPVYIMTSGREAGAYPAGGHYLFDIGEGSTVTRSRVLSGKCRTAQWNPADPDLDKQVFMLSHAMDDHPNEMLVLISRQLPFSMGVVTGDVIWPIIGGEVTMPVPMMGDMLVDE